MAAYYKSILHHAGQTEQYGGNFKQWQCDDDNTILSYQARSLHLLQLYSLHISIGSKHFLLATYTVFIAGIIMTVDIIIYYE